MNLHLDVSVKCVNYLMCIRPLSCIGLFLLRIHYTDINNPTIRVCITTSSYNAKSTCCVHMDISVQLNYILSVIL